MTAVLYQRLIRKLCPDCKVGYTPPADVLKKLGIPPGKVEQLYRHSEARRNREAVQDLSGARVSGSHRPV